MWPCLSLLKCFTGFSMDPLSRMSFSDLATDERLEAALPFGEELMKQNDVDVLCLPYTATPFALTEAARTLSFNDAIVEEDFRFDPATLRSHLVRIELRREAH